MSDSNKEESSSSSAAMAALTDAAPLQALCDIPRASQHDVGTASGEHREHQSDPVTSRVESDCTLHSDEEAFLELQDLLHEQDLQSDSLGQPSEHLRLTDHTETQIMQLTIHE